MKTKTLFILFHLFFMALISAQEEENIINEVVISDQKNIYTILEKVKKAFDENITYTKTYDTQIQVTSKAGEAWIDFSYTLLFDSLRSPHTRAILFQHPIFHKPPLKSYSSLQSDILSVPWSPVFYHKYFFTPNRKQNILSLAVDDDTYTIGFQSKHYEGKLIVDKATHHPIHFKKQLIQPYKKLRLISIKPDKYLNYFQREYILEVNFTSDIQEELYINSYIENEVIDPLIYNSSGSKKRQKEYNLSCNKNFTMQQVD